MLNPYILKTATFSLMLLFAVCANTQNKQKLSIQTYTASEAAAMANSHLVMGEKEAILVDVVMTRTEALKLSKIVRDSGKQLKMIFITHAHPDHFLGLGVLSEAFPAAKIVATAPVIEGISEKGPGLVERISARLGKDGPTKLIVPEPLAESELNLEGVKIEVMEFSEGESEHHAALFIPSTNDFIASDLIYNQTHLFLREKRIDGWLKQLDRIEKMENIKTIYPGHGMKTDLSVIESMRAYLQDFSEAVKLNDAGGAKAMMIEKYPDYKMPGFLDYSISAFFPADK